MKYGLLMAGILIIAILAFVVFVNYGKHIKENGVVYDMGQHRLRLLNFGKDEGFIFLGITFGNGYNFHSLVWEEMGKEGWVTKRVITQADFQSGTNRRRWVNDLYSFDSLTGRAVIKVAEGDAPVWSSSVRFIYSWRSWDINTNKQIELLQICKDGFEPYNPK